ncbi:MAG: hypothetical protein ACLFTB_07000 [Desulfovibrionales bacterium]
MKHLLFAALFAGIVMTSAPVSAHTPLFACFDNGDGTVLCEGGFSDGSSAAGVDIYIKDAKGNDLIKGQMSELSDFEFDKPESEYTVVFDAGEGHAIEIPGSEIVE